LPGSVVAAASEKHPDTSVFFYFYTGMPVADILPPLKGVGFLRYESKGCS
jgi:hypothetical protein